VVGQKAAGNESGMSAEKVAAQKLRHQKSHGRLGLRLGLGNRLN